MGMDVNGIEPATKAGRYFRASIWMWRPILERMRLLCGDLLSEDLLTAMAYNDGDGPKSQETCDKIAERLEAWLAEDSRDEIFLEDDPSTLRVTLEGRFLSDKEIKAEPGLPTRSPYSVSRAELLEFIEFLRSCGGFCVW